MAKPTGMRAQRDDEVSRGLVDDLLDVADDIRQLHTEFGGRPFRVFLVWARWTSDEDGDGWALRGEQALAASEVGVGRRVELRRVELLPTPRIEGLGGIGMTADAVGSTEGGVVEVRQISLSYTEDFLRGRVAELRDPESADSLLPGVEFWWEIVEARPPQRRHDATPASDVDQPDLRPLTRRFSPAATPNRAPYNFEWVVTLRLQEGASDRALVHRV